MALTIKHLNDDASFFLSFEPLIPHNFRGPPPKPFHILLDPWIAGRSTIFHAKISVAVHRERACISSLLELPQPDLVIISQDKTDHLNEATLRQLPRTGTKTVILVEPASARIIRSWKYFERDKVVTIPKWEDPRVTGRQTVIRIPVPSILPGGPGDPGEVTVAFIPQKRDISGLHSAIGITYRPPTVPPPPLIRQLHSGGMMTPPATPKSCGSHPRLRVTFANPRMGNYVAAPASPTSPTSLRSVRSAMSLSTSRHNYHSTLSQAAPDRPLSVLFSPHGISYSSLHGYVTSHLISEAALPLTALLHCFDAVSNPWWLGGNILLGAPAGVETATKLGAKAWISAHDGVKDIRGVLTNFLRTTRFRREDIVGRLSLPETVVKAEPQTPGPPTKSTSNKSSGKPRQNTEVLRLGIGEETVLTSEGVCAVEVRGAMLAPPDGTKYRHDESWLDLSDDATQEFDTEKAPQSIPPVPPLLRREGSASFANLEEMLNRYR